MRIAVPYEDGKVSQHYGSAPAFKFYDVEDGKIAKEEVVAAEGKGHYYMVQFLVTGHVDLVLCKSCGTPAQKTLQIAGIRLEMGFEGDADAAVRSYLSV